MNLETVLQIDSPKANHVSFEAVKNVASRITYLPSSKVNENNVNEYLTEAGLKKIKSLLRKKYKVVIK